MATEVTITDREFHQEIIDLCTNTHWTQGNIVSHCWVPEYEKAPPEGAKVIETTENNTEDGDEGPLYVRVKKWRKATYCIVGMVFKIANLYTPEQPEPDDVFCDELLMSEVKVADRYADDRYQVKRIIEQLYAQLPAEFVTAIMPDMDKNFEQPDHPAQSLHGESLDFYTKTIILEVWNDSNLSRGDYTQRTKEEVIDLVTRARDELPA